MERQLRAGLGRRVDEKWKRMWGAALVMSRGARSTAVEVASAIAGADVLLFGFEDGVLNVHLSSLSCHLCILPLLNLTVATSCLV